MGRRRTNGLFERKDYRFDSIKTLPLIVKEEKQRKKSKQPGTGLESAKAMAIPQRTCKKCENLSQIIGNR